MPSPEHAALVELFRERPSLVPLLLRHLGLHVPQPHSLDLADTTLPVAVPDFHVDLAVSVRDDRATARLVVLLEIQLAVDTDKPYRWLLYQAAAQNRHRCPVVLVVVAPTWRVSQWARHRLPVGISDTYAPVVLGPAELHALADDAGLLFPELAFLSALAVDPHHPDSRILRAAGEAIAKLQDDDRSRLYIDLLESKLGDAFFAAVEGIMIRGEPFSDRGKGYYRTGKAEGLVEGKLEGLTDALLNVLAARSLHPTPEQHKAILACKDLSCLERWVARAVTVQSIAELLMQI